MPGWHPGPSFKEEEKIRSFTNEGQTHRRFKPPCPHRSPHWVPHLKEGDVPPQGGKPGWAALPNPRIGPWLRLLKNIAFSHNLVPEFEITLEGTHHGPFTNKPTMFIEIVILPRNQPNLVVITKVPPGLDSKASTAINKGRIYISKTSPQNCLELDVVVGDSPNAEEVVGGGKEVRPSALLVGDEDGLYRRVLVLKREVWVRSNLTVGVIELDYLDPIEELLKEARNG
ncbi:hypothetical protein CMV_019731 [Castanea mollissima]|uniref:Uncharacterized protein n=1 Tax=Castanea mollissima TaxID=60419 RepID=A0A8J4R2H8_9ROSI|nr:hypothetical protein CMV_019731 [Castanea mollissima]